MEPEKLQAYQSRLHFILRQLQKMSNDLPPKYQQEINHEILSGLAHSLLHDKVFEMVKTLQEIQDAFETKLFQSRVDFIGEQKRKRHHVNTTKPNKFPSKTKSVAWIQQRELKSFDMKLQTQLDQKVSEQQVFMQKAGVPGFYVTNSPSAIRLQMYLLEFITNLSQMSLPSIPES